MRMDMSSFHIQYRFPNFRGGRHSFSPLSPHDYAVIFSRLHRRTGLQLQQDQSEWRLKSILLPIGFKFENVSDANPTIRPKLPVFSSA